MKELEFLHYRPGESFWHRHDPRLKILELGVWSALALAGDAVVVAAVFLTLTVLHLMAGTRFRRLARPLIFWLVMAMAIILAAGSADTGPGIRIIGRELPLSREGLTVGALKAARLLTVLLAGQLLASTTDPADLAEAVRRVTRFLPRIWSAALASAFSLTLTFVPLILDEAATIRDAAFSRGLGQRRSILRRAVSLGLPMAEATLRRADRTAEALIARGYVPDPTPGDIRIHIQDGLATVLVLLPAVIGMVGF